MEGGRAALLRETQEMHLDCTTTHVEMQHAEHCRVVLLR